MPQALIIENPARGPGGPGPRSGHQAGTKGSARPFERVGRGQLRRKARSAIWPVGQAVKTPASHAGNAGSIPARVTKKKRILSMYGDKEPYRVGVDDAEGPPVPIPNTEVKLSSAEDT